LYKNHAGAFSLPLAGWLYNIVGIILLIVFVILLYKEMKKDCHSRAGGNISGCDEITASSAALCPRNDSAGLIAYGLIILGGVSNIFDRLFYGYTVDYVAFLNFSFFNLADGMILAGIVLLLAANKKQTMKQGSIFKWL
jgi:lipoprotein signal peptidase